MRGPSLQKTAALSALLHLTVLVCSVVLINFSKTVVIPSPYTVSLLGPEHARHSGPPVSRSHAVESRAPEKEAPVKDSKMIDTGSKNEQKQIDERMSELLAKKKVRDIVRLRSVVISVKGGSKNPPAGPSAKEGGAGGPKGTPVDTYYGKVRDEIWREWVYPGMGKKDLEAVVSVFISRDGGLKVKGIEKSSGDLLFDRSALQAVTKASPVSPPPYEMEIGIRFYP